MRVPNRQIGWGQEAILLQGISKQLAFIAGLDRNLTPAGKIVPLEISLSNFTAWNNGSGNIDTNTTFGLGTFAANLNGYDTSTLGWLSLNIIIDGYQNTTAGTNASAGVTTNYFMNVSIGDYANAHTISDNNSVSFGGSALGSYASTGAINIAVGAFPLYYLTSGSFNTAVGANALIGKVSGVGDANVTGNYNIGVGFQSCRVLSSGNNNIHFDIEFGAGVSSGSRNIVFDGVTTPRNLNTFNNNVVIAGLSNSLLGVDGQIIIGTGASNTRRMEFDTTGAMTITIAPTNGGGVSTEKLILLDTVSDSNGMSSIKTIDYVDTNVTTVALTLANLNAAYPSASIGFRVNCISISGAPKIYTKVSTTAWCSETITNVA